MEAAAIKVDGEAYTRLPDDLYIPPDALRVFLETFEGPLDLLLYLIRRQNLDILNIPVARICEQYMEYIRLMRDMRFELAAEYLLMAAWLAEIKSRMLLPRPEPEAEEDADPRAELVRRLREYERFKTAAENLEDLPRAGRDVFVARAHCRVDETVPLPQPGIDEMLRALREALTRAELFTRHQVSREPLSQRECMSRVMAMLSAAHAPVRFTALLDPEEGRTGVVTMFTAILELLKDALIRLDQDGQNGPLRLSAVGGRALASSAS
jgi:segregation and condensation protein A